MVGFLIHPFVWIWTLFLVGALMALPDRFSQRLTAKDNLGNLLVIAAGFIALLFLNAVDFSLLARAGGFGLLRYVAHPYTIVWSLLVIGIIISIDDERSNKLLARNNLGKFLFLSLGLVLIFGIGFLRLDRLINFQLLLGILLGIGLARLIWRPDQVNEDKPPDPSDTRSYP